MSEIMRLNYANQFPSENVMNILFKLKNFKDLFCLKPSFNMIRNVFSNCYQTHVNDNNDLGSGDKKWLLVPEKRRSSYSQRLSQLLS